MTIEQQVWEEVCRRNRFRPKSVARKIVCSKDYVEKLCRKWLAGGILDKSERPTGFIYKIKD